jgi:hypothetical protein
MFIVSQIGDVIAQRNCKQFLNITTANRQTHYPLRYVDLNLPNQNTDQDSGEKDDFCTSCDGSLKQIQYVSMENCIGAFHNVLCDYKYL